MSIDSSRPPSEWYLYMVRSRLGHLYTGITTDVERRFQQHQSGQGAKALKGKGPLVLEFAKAVDSHSDALKLEAKVKKLNKAQKESLICDNGLWGSLIH